MNATTLPNGVRVEVTPLFATPVVLVDLPDVARLNADLRRVITEREKAVPGTQHSNLGGYQSSWDMNQWGGAAALRLLDAGRDVANRLTTDRTGQPVRVQWKANMWANVNRAGHGNEFHTHPGSFWSAVYYVDDGGIAADPALGGELEFMDPRGAAPAMYAPNLAFATPGGLSSGACESMSPRAGRMVMFPAWLLHGVRPYRGTAELIYIAFNLSV
jgi:uncharacterized protein (TIGR02466 family)